MNLTLSEKKIVKAILDNNSNKITNDIKNQYGDLLVKTRIYTGVGLYINFILNNDVHIEQKNDIILGGIHADVYGLEYGSQFILYIKDGMISTLECISYDEIWTTEELKVINIFKVKKDGTLEVYDGGV